jgi:hypothetical protein
MMTANLFEQTIRKALKNRTDLTIESKNLSYATGEFEVLRIASKQILPTDRLLLIRAGIHGDEIAGPLSVLEYCDAWFTKAHNLGIKIILYPLGNPSGFEMGTRYNGDGDRGDAGNGDFLRYELMDGTIVDDLGIKSDQPFKEWTWSSDPRLNVHLPLETQAMHEWLSHDPLSQVVACIDLHQDYLTPNTGPGAYAYTFGDTSVYKPIIEQIKQIVPVFCDQAFDAGFQNEQKMTTDALGCIERHDGSLTDLLSRMGAKHSITVETMGETPIEEAMEVNRMWVEGVMEMMDEKS